MDAESFWAVIGNYNKNTWKIQIVLVMLIIFCAVILFKRKMLWLPKVVLGITNLFIGVIFFLIYSTEAIQRFFAAPLFLAVGLIFLFEGILHRDNRLNPLSRFQLVLFLLVALYPVISFILGHSFPRIVLYIMPCPVISLSIVLYCCYEHKNKLLLILLTIWGLTGIKSFFFNAYEDVILLVCGLFCLYMLIKEIKRGMNKDAAAHRFI